MNVLILTPDRVGSTLLQRLITVYMQMHQYDQQVINLHELTNGLIKYYSPVFNKEVLGKPYDRPWGYYQTLPEITDLLNSTDHYKTARLAQYHISARRDPLKDQLPFYQYLNENFFIISAQRKNLLEHALSWGIHSHTKTLNVYSHQDKINKFAGIYQNKITIDPKVFRTHLENYKKYLHWVSDHFTVSSYFEYETHMPKIEEYILGLDIFNGQKTRTWKEFFDIEFTDWNRCHYLISDMSGMSAQLSPPSQQRISYDTSTADLVEVNPVTVKDDIVNSLSLADQQFLNKNSAQYVTSFKAIDELVANKILVTRVPIKLQTMMEKRSLIKNFDQCVGLYNDWATRSGIGDLYNSEEISQIALEEVTKWHHVARLE